MPTMNPRITFTVSEDLMKRIDDFRFENKLRNQTQAIVTLINLGFDSLSGKKLQPKFTEEEIRVVDAFNAADPISRLYAMRILEIEPIEKKKNRA